MLDPLPVVTLVHFYCGLRLALLLQAPTLPVRSNPCPFLLWIATIFCWLCRWLGLGSNPCPFLLWIATIAISSSGLLLNMSSNPCPFLLWIATPIIVLALFYFEV